MHCLELVKLSPLMDRVSGRREIVIGLIDGPVAVSHPDLASEHVRELPEKLAGTCVRADSVACLHGTFVAGILSAKRNSSAPAICPGCTLLVRPIFTETKLVNGQIPSAKPVELAAAIIDCIDAGAAVLNLSAALSQPSGIGQYELVEALDYAAQRGVIVVAAAGNQGTIGSSVITGHSWVIPVVAYERQGRPLDESNLGSSIGRRGLGAPGEAVTSLGAIGAPLTLSGTSVAAPFVTGAIALLLSAFPTVAAVKLKFVLTQAYAPRHRTVVPPLLDAWAAYQILKTGSRR